MSLNKIDLSFNLKDLKGNEIEKNAGELLADALAMKAEGISPTKAWDWATTLYKEHIINVDNSDKAWLKQYVEKSESLAVLSKAQILNALEVE